jgi:hypothetical protein
MNAVLVSGFFDLGHELHRLPRVSPAGNVNE